MKNLFIGLELLLLITLTVQCEKQLTYTCDVDTTKTGYELAGAYDDCLVWNAQKTLAHIESEDIDIRSTELPVLEFEGSYANMNAEENWIQPFYTVYSENMSAYPNAPASIN